MVKACSACFHPALRIPVFGVRNSSRFRTARYEDLEGGAEVELLEPRRGSGWRAGRGELDLGLDTAAPGAADAL